MYLTVGALLWLSYLVFSSPLHEMAIGPVRQLYKRDWVLECSNQMEPFIHAISAEVGLPFASLRDFCISYPHGVGIYCDVEGFKAQRQPESLISRVYEISHGFCVDHCHCRDFAPDIPSQEEEAPIARNSDSASECSAASDDGASEDIDAQSSSSTTCSHPEPTGEANADEYECNEYWYGRPNNQDCQQAMLRLPDHGATQYRHRQFLPVGVEPDAMIYPWPSIRTPLMLTHGHCTVAVLLAPPRPGHSRSIIVETLRLNNKAKSLHRKCVQDQGVGGKSSMEQHILRTFFPGPMIYMFAPNSKWKEYLDLVYHCVVDDRGSVECKQRLPTSKSMTDNRAHGRQDGVSIPKGSKEACSGSCYDLMECDINSDCLCSAPVRGVPLSSSWGQHSCTYVAGAAAAIVAAAIAPKKCRGRCLLQGNKTVDIDKLINTSNSTQLPFDSSRDSINLVGSSKLFPSVTAAGSRSRRPTAISNDTNFDTLGDLDSADSGYSRTSKANQTIASLNNNTANLESGRIPATSANSKFLPPHNATSPTHEYAIFNGSHLDQPSAIMHCPCNCTYVSIACCSSKIVYEDPSMQVHMDPPSSNSNVCCDPNSGRWLPKHSEKCSSNLTGTDFIGLGSVKWNSSVPLSLGDPKILSSQDHSI